MTTTEKSKRAVEFPIYEPHQDGCQFSTSCLTCPIPEGCYYELTAVEQRAIRSKFLKITDAPLALDIVAAVEEGLTLTQAAEVSGVSRMFATKLYYIGIGDSEHG